MNIFFISGQGHLYHAQDLIRQYSIESPTLIILYTKKNSKRINKIIDQVDYQLFSDIIAFEIPFMASKHYQTGAIKHLWQLKKLETMYIDLLCKLNASKVYVCNYNNHYILLHSICNKRNITINLFEEGVSTYSTLFPQLNTSLKERLILSLLLINMQFINIIKPYITFIDTLFCSFFYTLLGPSWFSKILFFIPSSYKKTLSKTDIEREWSSIYSSLPHLSKKIYTSECFYYARKKFQLTPKNQDILNESLKEKNITPNSIIFLNQYYNIPTSIHAKCIAKCLQENIEKTNQETIYIKFHPRENSLIKEEFIRTFIKYNLKIKVFPLEDIPIEGIIDNINPKTIISLASSSLPYIKMISPKTTIINIGDQYINYLTEEKIKHPIQIEKSIDETIHMLSNHIEIVKFVTNEANKEAHKT